MTIKIKFEDFRFSEEEVTYHGGTKVRSYRVDVDVEDSWGTKHTVTHYMPMGQNWKTDLHDLLIGAMKDASAYT